MPIYSNNFFLIFLNLPMHLSASRESQNTLFTNKMRVLLKENKWDNSQLHFVSGYVLDKILTPHYKS